MDGCFAVEGKKKRSIKTFPALVDFHCNWKEDFCLFQIGTTHAGGIFFVFSMPSVQVSNGPFILEPIIRKGCQRCYGPKAKLNKRNDFEMIQTGGVVIRNVNSARRQFSKEMVLFLNKALDGPRLFELLWNLCEDDARRDLKVRIVLAPFHIGIDGEGGSRVI
ncbi:MAG: hypothetical protein HY360_10075 [Verrucomicrobia bacterium]|nr:hypothetical protein [Verrucomicrobiota bacterium]